MLVNKGVLIRHIFVIVFSSQIVVSAIVYFNNSFGTIINSIFITLLSLIFYSTLRSLALASYFLFFIPVWMLFSSFMHIDLEGWFNVAAVLKPLFVALSFSVGLQCAKKYNWELKDFSIIGLLLLVCGIGSLILGKIIGVTVSDITYQSGLVGLSVHPAITAMLISSGIPYLVASGNRSLYLVVIAYICVFLTMRRTAVLASFPFLLISFRQYFFRPSIVIMFFMVFFLLPFLLPTSLDSYLVRLTSVFSGEDAGSGRLVFWSIIIHRIFEFDLYNIFFGEGTGVLTGLLSLKFGAAIGAHNDFLDLLFTYGFLASFALLLFYIYIGRLLFLYRKARFFTPIDYWCGWAVLSYLLFTSIISGGALDIQASALYFALGICLSNCQSKIIKG